mgnify:CR=1 FL=1
MLSHFVFGAADCQGKNVIRRTLAAPNVPGTWRKNQKESLRPTFRHAMKMLLVTVASDVLYGPPREAQPLCVVQVDDFWVSREDGPWVIAYRSRHPGHAPGNRRVRVYPRIELDPGFTK